MDVRCDGSTSVPMLRMSYCSLVPGYVENFCRLMQDPGFEKASASHGHPSVIGDVQTTIWHYIPEPKKENEAVVNSRILSV